MLLTTDESYLMTLTLADEVMSRIYGSVRSNAEYIATAIGCGFRCNALDVQGVREKLRAGRHLVDLPDISPGEESHFLLTTILQYEEWKDQVYLQASQGTSGEPVHRKPPAPVKRQSHKDPRAERARTRDGAKRRPGASAKVATPRAGGGAEPETPPSAKKPTSEDPFQIYTREERRAHYKKMK